MSTDHALATSIRQFSKSLEKMAKRQPERFGRLALRFPNNVDPSYLYVILDGCSQKSPDSDLSNEKRESWQPASRETVEAVLKKFQAGDDRDTAMSFCRLISKRSEEQWTDETLARLVYYAQNHTDPEPGKLNLDGDKSAKETSVKTLFQNTINCVRGAAAGAIEKLLWENTTLLEKLRPGIESLVRDHHPAVRMAPAEMLLPVLNIDKDQAVEWFVMACEEDLRVAASPRAAQFYNYTIPSHLDRIGPIIQKMVHSSRDDVAREGARQVTARWLYHSYFEDELYVCQRGKIPQRQGISDAASQLLHEFSYSQACKNLLSPLFNDPDKEVRDQCHRLFHRKELWNDATLKPFILEYIHSPAFTDHPEGLVSDMKDFTGSVLFLADPIFSMCDVFSSNLKDNTRDFQTSLPHNVFETVSFLLRLYDHAFAEGKTGIVNRCLDVWDTLLQNRVGIARDLTKAIES